MPNFEFCQKYYYSFSLQVPFHPMTTKKKKHLPFEDLQNKTKQTYNLQIKGTKFKIE
jgi:hypothetical protein